jgi:quercetin dioxygenase-like cupin family protein
MTKNGVYRLFTGLSGLNMRQSMESVKEMKMIIKKMTDVPIKTSPEYVGVEKQILIGPEDGSNEIILRYFRLSVGMLIYIPDNELHGFKNTGSGTFDFICIVPERGEIV